MSYDINIHQHRFAAWAASRAASSTNRRFSVSAGASWLEEVGLNQEFLFEHLPQSKAQFDGWHGDMRNSLIGASEHKLTHGQAAKLINCYLKSRFINSWSMATPAACVAHPPIDRLLLSTVLKKKLLCADSERRIRKLRDAGWSNWGSDSYENAIHILRSVNPNAPFWTIEENWIGYQEQGQSSADRLTTGDSIRS
jgi:hypothetical protein